MTIKLYAYIAPVARVTRLIAALLFAAVCLRFSALAVAQRFFATAEGSGAARGIGDAALEEIGKKWREEIGPEKIRSFSADNRLNLVPNGQTIRVGISVTVRGKRSSVYLNGQLRGRTPFIGDVACKKGEAIRIELEPEGGRGRPRTIERACDAEVIYVRE